MQGAPVPGDLSADPSCACGASGTTTTSAQPITQINLTARDDRASPAGIAEVLKKGHGYAVAIVAQGVMPAGAHQGRWPFRMFKH